MSRRPRVYRIDELFPGEQFECRYFDADRPIYGTRVQDGDVAGIDVIVQAAEGPTRYNWPSNVLVRKVYASMPQPDGEDGA
jgi:hypothetical protein